MMDGPPPPLIGVRVLDLTQALAGPMATRLLADLGAEVIKIEIPGTGDSSRRMGTNYPAGESLYFMTFNRNKKSIALDLRRPKGVRSSTGWRKCRMWSSTTSGQALQSA